jgi:hypothetical protein
MSIPAGQHMAHENPGKKISKYPLSDLALIIFIFLILIGALIGLFLKFSTMEAAMPKTADDSIQIKNVIFNVQDTGGLINLSGEVVNTADKPKKSIELHFAFVNKNSEVVYERKEMLAEDKPLLKNTPLPFYVTIEEPINDIKNIKMKYYIESFIAVDDAQALPQQPKSPTNP